jgi:ADP-ribosyl-[dinitrogen reductase] hydrolase
MTPPPPKPRSPAKPRTRGVLTGPSRDEDRARGALLGLAVGDALGAPHEFHKFQAPVFPTLAKGPHTEMRGGGPHALKPGQVSKDGQMACALAASLHAHQKLDPEDVANRYAKWKLSAFDVAPHVVDALELRGKPAQTPATYGREIWLRSTRMLAPNTALARTAPIGVLFFSNTDGRIEASLAEAAITDFDPRCRLACAFWNGAIAFALRHAGELRKEQMIEAATIELTQAAAHLGRAEALFIRDVQNAVTVLKEDIALAQKDNPLLYGPELTLHGQPTFVRVAFRLALWEFWHAPSFAEALVDIVNRGGDTDTLCAITGSLLGAYYGEKAIPQKWRDAVLSSLSEPRDRQTLFGSTLHPRQMLKLLEGPAL